MTTIRLSGGDLGGEMVDVRCNLSQASAPVQVNYHAEPNSEWAGTQYQCADTRHTASGLIEIGKLLAARAVEVAADKFACDAEEL